MSTSVRPARERLLLPDALRLQLLAYRRRVWFIKLLEAAAAALFGLMAAFLTMFLADRVWETPAAVRALIFAGALAGVAWLPVAVHRWVWGSRRLDQLARLLARRHPRLGDQLLGVIELVRSDAEQARSRALCEAAIEQVAAEASERDFRAAVPDPKHRAWAWMAGVPAVAALGLLALYPAAAANAWQRMIAPWRSTPRYTFAGVEPLPAELVVAHGEPFSVSARLRPDTVWKPREGVIGQRGRDPLVVPLRDNSYAFEIPAQLEPGWLEASIGDWGQRVRVRPTPRPELTSVSAEVTLPAYLERPGTQTREVRGGTVSLVKGSSAVFTVTAGRDLSAAEVDGQARAPIGPAFSSLATRVDAPRTLEFRWRDVLGLAGKTPFALAVDARDDEAPTLVCEDLPRQKVVLDSEVLAFQVKAQDDFGIRRIGMQWQGVENASVKEPARGERLLASGGPDREAMDVRGAFSAKSAGIEPQPIQLRVFAEDYFPGRPRVYSPPYLIYVLSAEQHAVWLTEQLSKWHHQSLEVRDREMQLHEVNKELRSLPAAELDRPETRRRIESQAQAERANGRRLSGLVSSGEDLVKQAMRNPEFGVGHLEKWAEMLQVLKDISAARMPVVADLLREAAQSPVAASRPDSKRSPAAGMIRDTRTGGKPQDGEAAKKSDAAVPLITDRESSQQPLEKNASPPPGGKSAGQARLSLPTTTVAGKAPAPESCPTGQKMDQAVARQEDLLAEFEKIADALNRVLANLEGSTLVKRLKAASRKQYTIAGRMADTLPDAFGLKTPIARSGAPRLLEELSQQEARGSQEVSVIMDDMHAYFERRRFMQFKTVLDEMRQLDVVGGLRQLGDDLKKENGLSIAQCEFWSDNLDRWADDLVDPVSGGT